MPKSVSCLRPRPPRSSLCAHLDKARVRPPAVNHAPFNVPHFSSLALSEQLVQAAACRAAAVLGVLRKRDRTLHPVLLHFQRGLVRKGLCIPKRDIRFVRSGRRVKFVQQRGHPLTLNACILEDRRTTANVFVLFLDLGCPPPRNNGREHRLERQRNEVTVREKVL